MSTFRETELERLVDAATMAAIGFSEDEDDISFTQEQEQEEAGAAQEMNGEDQISFASSDSIDENRWRNDDLSLSPDVNTSIHSSSSSSYSMEIPTLLVPQTYEHNQKPSLEIKSNLSMFELPLDAIHAIASFLTLDEWRQFGMMNRDASLACREILQKVKMHSFLCAVEVVSAWNRGEHADAKELAALYIHSGVPIYPCAFGHSYHTIYWRMEVEADHLQDHEEQQQQQGEEPNTHNTTEEDNVLLQETRNGQVDRFYLARHEARNVGGYYLPTLTYLEEKGLFWRCKNEGKAVQLTPEQRRSSLLRLNIRPPPPHIIDGIGYLGFFDEDDDFANLMEQRRIIGIGENVTIGPNDANFGHLQELSQMRELDPNFSSFHLRRHSSRCQDIAPIKIDEKDREPKLILQCHKHLIDQHLQGATAICDDMGSMPASSISLSQNFFHPNLSRPFPNFNQRYEVQRARVLNSDPQFRPPSRISSRVSTTNDTIGNYIRLSSYISEKDEFIEHSIVSKLELYSYDSTTGDEYNVPLMQGSFKRIKPTKFDPPLSHKQVTGIIARYQRQLALLLKRADFKGFDECLFDFWDEFFPLTKYVHFYDRHTPVPRMSKLHSFLTKPIPKAFGTMQCEIERVKVKYRIKGMIPGRYHHTYEYKLFIKDRRKVNYDNSLMKEEGHPRFDTLLMTAKYRGKHFSGSTGLVPLEKKGVNHYFLYMPQDKDIDEHMKASNQHVKPNNFPAYKQDIPATGSILELCRLQTNHMGTEFQITAPMTLGNESDSTVLKEANVRPSTEREKKVSPVNQKKKKDKRKNKKLSARITPFSFKKSIDPVQEEEEEEESYCAEDMEVIGNLAVKEVEIGAITYTANVLGNRPRIMNVTIPEIIPETGLPVVSPNTWTKDPGEEGQMLNRLKELQLRRYNDNFGLMSLQNRPPWWNVALGAFVLNFGGRVSVASVKNFQLCDRDDHENIMLQFGRIEGRHSFTMDFSYPLSPVQAFAISISSLQSKISFS
jgi:hypothetical protein